MSYTKLMLNGLETIRNEPTARRFDIGDLLFAQYHCPASDTVGVWTKTDYLLHVLSAKTSWKTSKGTWTAVAGESVFFKKGAYVMPQHIEEDLCLEFFFIPDAFIKETVMDLAADLPVVADDVNTSQLTIRVNNDAALSAFFQAMGVYFASDENPPEPLLKLKLKELLTSILVGQSNPALSAYFRFVASNNVPAIAPIMEMNFCHNLSIECFAEMCNRSLSSFKREFRKQYGMSPGKWLHDRRLQHSACLLETTTMNVTDIMFECGFEDLSHFSRAFKVKFGCSPSLYREVFVVAHR
ncbi:MAG TPA: AraC family transcriptional regulator [Acidobacteriota bacterium]|nr:AraC family transcriptional regulator [Acidobacteriota bacterium]